MLKPIVRDRVFFRVGFRRRLTSAIHVRDCARALVHLSEHGRAGERYFVVDDLPLAMDDLARLASRVTALQLLQSIAATFHVFN